jgi:hypothetical protein
VTLAASSNVLLTKLPLTLAVPAPPVTVAEDDADGAIPAELREWLVRLRLLEGVPFAYLVADTALLPEESIRWFYLDRRWTDALVQGALSVGTVNTDDRTQLTAQYPAVRDELDREERNLRRRPGAPRWAGGAGPISGFVLRSRAVSGWPRCTCAPSRSTRRTRTRWATPRASARTTRGACGCSGWSGSPRPVLLCLFDGVPKVVHVEEPRQGVQFGFERGGDATRVSATLTPRRASDFAYLPGPAVDVRFRADGAPGVVDIQRLERDLAARPDTGAADGLDSAEYAQQLVRFPFRQVFGDPRATAVSVVFRPTVSYATMVSQVFRTA